MSNEKRMIGGRLFTTKVTFEEALRDQKKIEKIRATIDFTNYNQVLDLSNKIANGDFHFQGLLGGDFDDEIYELSMTLKKQNKEEQNTKLVEKENLKSARGKKQAYKFNKKQFNKEKKKQAIKEIKIDDYSETMQNDIKEELKKKEIQRKLIVLISMFVMIISVGYLAIYSYMTAKTDANTKALAMLKGKEVVKDIELEVYVNKETKEEIVVSILDEYKSIYQKNKKLIGWVKIDDTLIDYPVMQTENNEYYLEHNFDQEYDKNGSIFMDFQCDPITPSTNLILYGHHMNSGKMFGGLVNYKSVSYYEDHSIIEFDTIYEKGSYEIMYVFPAEVYSEEEIAFKYYQFFDALTPEEFNSNMNEMSKLSLYDTGVTARFGDELLTLSTCDYEEENGRFVVVAKKLQ